MKQSDLNIENRLRQLEQMFQRQERAISSLKSANRELAGQVHLLTAHKNANNMAGLSKARVESGEDGGPAALDNRGGVRVKAHGLTLGDSALDAQVASPWLIPEGGIQFLPRNRQAVYMRYMNESGGGSHTPVILGHNANEGDSIPLKPYSDLKQKNPKSSAPLAWDGKNDDWPVDECENQYQSMISSAGKAKNESEPKAETELNQIIFSDKEQKESLSIGSQGDLLFRAGKDRRQLVGGDLTEITQGASQYRVDQGRSSTVHGHEDLQVKKGNLHIEVEGDEEHSVEGSYTLDIGNRYKMECHEDWLEKHHMEFELEAYWGAHLKLFAELYRSIGLAPHLEAQFDVGVSFRIALAVAIVLGFGYEIEWGKFSQYYLGSIKSTKLVEVKEILCKKGGTLADLKNLWVANKSQAAF